MSDLLKGIAALITALIALVTLLVTLGVLKSPTGLSPEAAAESAAASGRPAFTERLGPNDQITPGQDLVSLNGKFRLTLRSDGDLVLVANAGNKTLWSAST